MKGCVWLNKSEKMTTAENRRTAGREWFSMTIMQTNNNVDYSEGILQLQIVSIVYTFLKSQAVCWISKLFLLVCIFLCKWMPLNKCSCGDDTSFFPHYHKSFPEASCREKKIKIYSDYSMSYLFLKYSKFQKRCICMCDVCNSSTGHLLCHNSKRIWENEVPTPILVLVNFIIRVLCAWFVLCNSGKFYPSILNLQGYDCEYFKISFYTMLALKY